MQPANTAYCILEIATFNQPLYFVSMVPHFFKPRLLFFYCPVLLIFFHTAVLAQETTLQPTFVALAGSRNYDDIKVLLEDSKGFLWFGSNQGLVRFDGNAYHRFEPGNSRHSIASDIITALYESNDGTIWIGTADKGLYSYCYNTDTFSLHLLPQPFPVIHSIDKYNDDIVVSTGKGVFIKGRGRDLELLSLTGQLRENNTGFAKTVQDPAQKNILWMLSTTGLYSWDIAAGRLKKWHDNGFSTDELGNVLTTLEAGNNGKIYSSARNKGLIQLDMAAGITSHYTFSKNSTTAYSSNNIDAIAGFDDNHLFVATQDSGVGIFNRLSGIFHFLRPFNFLESGSQNIQAKAFALSRRNLLMATQHDGIWVFNKASMLFPSTSVPSAYNKVPGTLYTRSLHAAANGKVYAGSYFGDGLYVFDADGAVTAFPFLPANNGGKTLIINAIFRDHNNITWLASHENGILIFDEATQKIIPAATLFPALKNIAAQKIYCFHEDKDHQLYIATGDAGLLRVDAARQSIRHYVHQDKDSTSILTDNLFAEKIFEDNKGRLWLSTRRGITVLETSRQQFYHFVNEPGKYNAVPAAFWYSFQQDDKGFVYIGTGEGIFKITPDDRSLFRAQHFTEKNGLQHNNVFSFVKDRKGLLWITCRTGLSCFNPAVNRFVNFNYKNGLPAKTLMAPMTLDADGKIYHGAVEKYFSFDPSEVLKKNDSLKVWLTNFKIFDKDSIDGFALNSVRELELFHNQNSFSFSFVSPSVYYPDAVVYAYMLEGFDKEWLLPGNRNYVSYTNVSPGTYTFKVKAAGPDGVWSDAVTSVVIVISPPFWETWWFRTLLLLGIAALVYSFIKYREKVIARREAEKTEMEKLKALSYQYELEIEQVTNFFGSAINKHNSINDMLWDIAKNLIGKLGFEECMIYLWNDNKTMLVQQAGYGLKGDMQIAKDKEAYHIPRGKGIVGLAAESGEYVLVNDTSKDSHYFSADEKIMFSELSVPIVINNEVVGIINTEHCKKNFFKDKHVKILSVIASLCADKMEKITAEKQAREKEIELLKLHKDLADWQITALRAQMNPHFIFNAMNSIQQFTLQNDTDNANLYLSKFSLLLRKVLHTSQHHYITLEEEVEQLRLYLDIEKLRMGNDFVFEISVEEEIEADALRIPGMLVQPFVENAIKHGLPLKVGIKQLTIHFTMPDEDHLHAIVTDNGIGRKRAEELKKQQLLFRHESKGIDLVNHRLQLLEQDNGSSTGVQIDDLPDDAGTRVTLIIPVA